MKTSYVCPVCGEIIADSWRDEDERTTEFRCKHCSCYITAFDDYGLRIDCDGYSAVAQRWPGHPKALLVYLYNDDVEDSSVEMALYDVELDRKPTAEDFERYVYIGFDIARQIYKKYSMDVRVAECDSLWEQVIQGEPSIAGTEPSELDDIDWSKVGPRAVFGMINALYALKIEQGMDDNAADRESDEETCELTGLTLCQLSELYSISAMKSY